MKSIEVQAELLQKILANKVNSRNSRHSEKTENLASSVDFRLIQNLLMLIIFIMSGWDPDLLFDMVYSLLTTPHSLTFLCKDYCKISKLHVFVIQYKQ